MFRKKILSILVIALLVMSSMACVDAKGFNKDYIYANVATGYATYVNIYFLDINKERLYQIDEGHGVRCRDVSMKVADKKKYGAEYMQFHIKPYGGGKWWNGTYDEATDPGFTYPIQGAYLDIMGNLGSSARMSWQFQDGTNGWYNF
jgi:hypothetical protein